MPERSTSSSQLRPVRVDLQSYVADIQLNSVAVGVDNIHYDVFLSPRFVDMTRRFLVDSVRQMARLAQFFGSDAKSFQPPEVAAFRKLLGELLQATLTRAKFENNIELDLLFRVAILRFLTSEITTTFADQILECKERLRSRGALFERSEQSHVLHARLAEVQADRRNILRQVGQQIHLVLCDLEDSVLAKLRRALFGDDFAATYELLKNRLLFLENGKDDFLFLEQYVLLGSFARDHDRFESINTLLIEFLGDFVLAGEQGREVSEAYKQYDELSDKGLATGAELARLEEEREAITRKLGGGGDLLSRLTARKDPAELRAALADVEKRLHHLQQKLELLSPQIEEARRRADSLTAGYHGRLGDYLNEPSNARRLFDPKWTGGGREQDASVRERLLEEWITRLQQRDLLAGVLAAYEMRSFYGDYCPPVHLQQLKKALINRDELKRVEDILRQFPARRLSARKIEDISKALQRWPREKVRDAAIRFAEDFMRLRRDTRNYERLTALMERVNLVRVERTRELSRINNSLYELLLAEEAGPAEDRVISHVIIKADVRGSTRITHELLARGLNPASYFSMNLHEPVKKILERFGAAKVFIEGDAIILSILETQANRAHQRAVARACVLAQQILTVSNAYNARVTAAAEGLPRLELGVGVAYQDSAPAYWSDGDSRIMISKALNLSDRLSGCSKAARRMLPENASPFNLFLFQTVAEAADEEEAEEFMIRYNLNGVQLNEEGFQKLQKEISLTPIEVECHLPWGPERVTLYAGEILIGEVFEHIIVRKGVVRQLTAGKIGEPVTHSYYEVCTGSKVANLLEKQLSAVRKA